MEGKKSVEAIPNLALLTGNVLNILRYLERPDIKNLVETDQMTVKMTLNEMYADSVPYGVIDLLINPEKRKENVKKLLEMFEILNMVKNGDMALDRAEEHITEDLNERYLYSKFASKEEFYDFLKNEKKNDN